LEPLSRWTSSRLEPRTQSSNKIIMYTCVIVIVLQTALTIST
jgi:hypothetical protein